MSAAGLATLIVVAMGLLLFVGTGVLFRVDRLRAGDRNAVPAPPAAPLPTAGAATAASSPPVGLEFVWSEAVRLIDAQLRLGADTDSKTAPLIGGALAGLGVLAAQKTFSADATAILEIILGAEMAFLLFSFQPRNFAFAPALTALISWANASPPQIREAFLSNMSDAYLLNLDTLSVKAFYLRWSRRVLVVFAVTLVLQIVGGRMP
jgi:hypothetical protein